MKRFFSNTPMDYVRIGLGITFLWIGVLIFKNPEGWANFLDQWFVNLLPIPAATFMKGISFLDMALGAALLLNFYTKLVAAICALHLIGILISSGITDVTIRDVGLLGASIGLFLSIKEWTGLR